MVAIEARGGRTGGLCRPLLGPQECGLGGEEGPGLCGNRMAVSVPGLLGTWYQLDHTCFLLFGLS